MMLLAGVGYYIKTKQDEKKKKKKQGKDDDGMEIDDTENIDLREETPNSQDAREPEPDLRDSQRG